MSLVRNEQTKLLANNLDRASTACFTVGIATPAAGWLYNVANFQASISPAYLLAALAGWLIASVSLHVLARRILKGLRP